MLSIKALLMGGGLVVVGVAASAAGARLGGLRSISALTLGTASIATIFAAYVVGQVRGNQWLKARERNVYVSWVTRVTYGPQSGVVGRAALFAPAAGIGATVLMALADVFTHHQAVRLAALLGLGWNTVMMAPALNLPGHQITAGTRAWIPGVLVLVAGPALIARNWAPASIAFGLIIASLRFVQDQSPGSDRSSVTAGPRLGYLATASGLLLAALLIRLGG